MITLERLVASEPDRMMLELIECLLAGSNLAAKTAGDLLRLYRHPASGICFRGLRVLSNHQTRLNFERYWGSLTPEAKELRFDATYGIALPRLSAGDIDDFLQVLNEVMPHGECCTVPEHRFSPSFAEIMDLSPKPPAAVPSPDATDGIFDDPKGGTVYGIGYWIAGKEPTNPEPPQEDSWRARPPLL